MDHNGHEKVCQLCGGKNILEVINEKYCGDCGQIFRRNTDDENNKSHCESLKQSQQMEQDSDNLAKNGGHTFKSKIHFLQYLLQQYTHSLVLHGYPEKIFECVKAVWKSFIFKSIKDRANKYPINEQDSTASNDFYDFEELITKNPLFHMRYNKPLLLTIIFFSLRLSGEIVFFSDFIRLCETGIIPIHQSHKILPESFEAEIKCTATAYNCAAILTSDLFFGDVCALREILSLPLNHLQSKDFISAFAIYSAKITQELLLPAEIHVISVRFFHRFLKKVSEENSNFKSDNIWLMIEPYTCAIISFTLSAVLQDSCFAGNEVSEIVVDSRNWCSWWNDWRPVIYEKIITRYCKNGLFSQKQCYAIPEDILNHSIHESNSSLLMDILENNFFSKLYHSSMISDNESQSRLEARVDRGDASDLSSINRLFDVSSENSSGVPMDESDRSHLIADKIDQSIRPIQPLRFSSSAFTSEWQNAKEFINILCTFVEITPDFIWRLCLEIEHAFLV